MTPSADNPRARLAQLDNLRAEPERTCQWCLARPGEWCDPDCANPQRQCHPTYVAEFAAERGAYADADAAMIVAAVNALPDLTDALNRVLELADALTTRYPEAGPNTQRLLAAIAADIRSAITDALKGDQA